MKASNDLDGDSRWNWAGEKERLGADGGGWSVLSNLLCAPLVIRVIHVMLMLIWFVLRVRSAQHCVRWIRIWCTCPSIHPFMWARVHLGACHWRELNKYTVQWQWQIRFHSEKKKHKTERIEHVAAHPMGPRSDRRRRRRQALTQ